MDEYIEREAVLQEMTSKPLPKDPRYLYLAMRGIVRKAPAADVEEVKHGYWKGKPIAGFCTVRCTVCGMAFSENSGRWLYCPNCGAKMDLKEGAEE